MLVKEAYSALETALRQNPAYSAICGATPTNARYDSAARNGPVLSCPSQPLFLFVRLRTVLPVLACRSLGLKEAHEHVRNLYISAAQVSLCSGEGSIEWSHGEIHHVLPLAADPGDGGPEHSSWSGGAVQHQVRRWSSFSSFGSRRAARVRFCASHHRLTIALNSTRLLTVSTLHWPSGIDRGCRSTAQCPVAAAWLTCVLPLAHYRPDRMTATSGTSSEPPWQTGNAAPKPLKRTGRLWSCGRVRWTRMRQGTLFATIVGNVAEQLHGHIRLT